MSGVMYRPPSQLQVSRYAPSSETDHVAVWRRFTVFALLHAVYFLVADRLPILSTIHAWCCLLYGVHCASSGRSHFQLAQFAAYVMGVEVVWRMTSANCFWEMGKYAISVMFIVHSLKSRPIRPTAVAGWYSALMVPSALITFSELGFTLARKEVSFNLSGPLLISASAAFFSRCRFSSQDWNAFVRAALLPLMSMWAIVVAGIASAEKLSFSTESNTALSGGFGPNQVSTLFGMGAMLAVMSATVLEPKSNRVGRSAFLFISLLLGAQAALTFSRSGMYLAVTSIACSAVFSLRNAKLRNAYIVSGVFAYIVAVYVIYPRLDEFTGGKLSERFEQTGGTGREVLIQSDLEVAMAHPLFGTGPGLAAANRVSYFHAAAAAHCEVTRALAEHGLFGLASLSILAISTLKRLLSIRDPQFRSLAVACSAFGILCMISNAMRIAAPGLLIGVCFASEYVAPRRIDHRQPVVR